MRLVTFVRDGRERVGVQLPGEHGPLVLDLSRTEPDLPVDMTRLLAAGEPALDRARAAAAAADPATLLPASDVTLLAPVPRPGKILCVGYNYRGHAAAGTVELPDFPEIFAKTANTVIGPGAAVVLPRVSRQVDYEAELAVVVGRRGRDIPEADALDHVAGYCIFDDVSARDYQGRGTQWLLGKSFDTFGPLGPTLVTRDEVPDPQCLDLELTVNGVVMQRASTRDMIFTVPYLVAYLSTVMTLEPGDIIATGTPAKLPEAERAHRFLRHGDVIDIMIGNLGTLTSTVVSDEHR
ncbi:fumarylacetoacetate hydrolase family protein [Cellulomonas sp. KRMCY2]|uniref:fumarylacetoacetate hydrolase family protein n=1 Tax=Cellulomonas sp. KRMCY2 TaxID=1304865 RepID=UPI00045EB12E|nr:fumarylacetoacetate hydrolase family protein [Cellulomonas sp. KRMCY2]